MAALMTTLTYCRAVIRARLADTRGASVIEYAFLVSLIAVFCIGAMSMIGGTTSVSLSETAEKLP